MRAELAGGVAHLERPDRYWRTDAGSARRLQNRCKINDYFSGRCQADPIGVST